MQTQWRKRPIEITAEQFDPEKVPWPKDVESEEMEDGSIQYTIPTLEGMASFRPGDFIVTGIAGERYPVPQDIFYDTYDPVGQDDETAADDNAETRRNQTIRFDLTPAEACLELSKRIGRGEIISCYISAKDIYGNSIVCEGRISVEESPAEVKGEPKGATPPAPPPFQRESAPMTGHASDCAVHNAPAEPVGKCDCGYVEPKEGLAQPAGLRMSGAVKGDGTVK